jgi:integrase
MTVDYDAPRGAHGLSAHKVSWFTGPAGDRQQHRKYFATRADADAFKARHDRLLAQILPAPSSPPPLPSRSDDGDGPISYRRFAETWLADIIERRKPATKRSYEGLLKLHVYPHLGDTLVTDDTLSVSEVVHVVTKRAQAGVKWGTQKAILRVLSSSLRWAVKSKRLRVNPALGLLKDLKDDSGDYVEPEPNPLTPEQATAFLHWLATGAVVGAPTDRAVDGPKLRGGQLRSRGYPEWVAYFLTLLRTGMRRGEAAALKWDAVYLDRVERGHPKPIVRLEASYSPSAKAAGKHSDGTLKGKRAHDVDLSAELVDELREFARTRRADALKARRQVSPYVFVTARGKRVLSDFATAERVFERGMAALGLVHTIHDLRDTFATSQLISGAPLLWVSSMLGHRDPSTTLRRYARWVPGQPDGYRYASALDSPTRAKLR